MMPYVLVNIQIYPVTYPVISVEFTSQILAALPAGHTTPGCRQEPTGSEAQGAWGAEPRCRLVVGSDMDEETHGLRTYKLR